jgi:two-component system cell cycle sensor histidine kinase/response regulator CckA
VDISIVVISLSIVLQLIAAFFAIRLLTLPGRRIAGLLTLTIIFLMTFRRFISLYRFLAGEVPQTDIFAESVALSVSFFLLIGILYLFRLIRSEHKMASMFEDSKQHYQTLFNQSPDGVLLIDMNGRIIEFNDAAARDLGYTREEFLKLHLSDINPFENPEETKKRMEDILRKGKAEFEVRHRTKGGDERYVHVITQAVESAGKRVLHSIWRDITEQKYAEKALKENERFLQTIIETEPECIKLVAADGTLLMMNRAGLAMIEAESLDQVKGQCLYPIVTEEYRNAFQSLTENVFKGKSGMLEFEAIGINGRHVWLETRAVPLRNDKNEIIALLGVTRDITESKRDVTQRKQAEERLIKSEGRLRESQEVARLGSWDLDLVSKKLEWSDETYILFDKTREEFAPSFDAFARMVHPDDLQTMQTNFNNALKSDDNPYHIAVRAINDSGREWVMETFGAVRRDKDGSPIGIFGTVQDITEQKKTEVELRHKEEMMRNLLDSVDEGFIVVDRDYRILSANRAYCNQVGLAPEDVLGKNCYEISHSSARPCFESGVECAPRLVFETGEPHVSVHRHSDKGSDVIYVETKAFPLKDSSGQVTAAIEVINNITEKQLLEEQRLKTQKLEAVGTLAGGIAHDFNNLLQGVFGYISMAKASVDQRQKCIGMLEQAEKALHMSVNLTTQLLTFSKGGRPVRKTIEFGPVIENSVKFALSGSRVDYNIEIDEALWRVDADEGQIGQVIQNIVLNAEQAMPLGGTVKIRADNIRAPQKGIPTALPPGNYVGISINDSGIGIPEEYLPKIFDPYFTTKDKGSGLGLATSYSIVKNHGGMIDVKSEPGKGSTFIVLLPAIETVEVKAETAAAHGPLARKFRILLMDDEELIRNIAGEMLRSLGHEVEFAVKGEEAIARYRESLLSGAKFDIVILDLTIRGGMGGEEAIKALREIDPGVKAVVSSGYAGSSAISQYQPLGFRACLAKPYSIGKLKDTLNSLMD